MSIPMRDGDAIATFLTAAAVIALYILFVQDFSSALNNFIALLVVWVGPFGGVWICDGFLRRGKFDFRAIHSTARSAGRYWGWRCRRSTTARSRLRWAAPTRAGCWDYPYPPWSNTH